MNEQENSQCPYCGALVSKTDKYCKNCGKVLIKYSDFAQSQPTQPAWSTPIPPLEETYERKYSMFQRFYKLIFSPSEAMKDIALAPDYGGPIVLVILRIIITAIGISVVLQKFQLVGDTATINYISSTLFSVMAIAIVISVFLFLAFWLIKSFLVKLSCDKGSGWNFATAASVTGYAYIADFIFGIVGVIAIYFLIPSMTFDVTNLDAATSALANWEAQTYPVRLAYSIPIGFVGLIWKSFLGGLGTKFGTKENSSLAFGFFVFLVLALLGWLISYLVTGNV
mgnify:CR=1 FL=1